MSIPRLKEFLKDKNSAALITSEENVRYFTSFSSTNGYLLVTGERSVFLTDSRYIEAAESCVLGCDEVKEIKSISETLVPLITSMGVSAIHIEADRMTVASLGGYRRLLPDVSFVTDGALDREINLMRSVKTREEVQKIEKAQRIAEKAFDHILTFISAGKTEREISLELDYAMLRGGADALSFETIAVAGKNGSKPHGVPGENTVKSGDFLTLDFGAVVGGYHSDMTRTVAVGTVAGEQARVYETVLAAQKAGLLAVKSGESCRDVDEVSRKIIRDAGYGEYFGHGLGHGVGAEIHEFPSLSPKSEAVLQSGSVVTVEPGIYLPGKFGVRIEDMVLVTDSGCINFTKSEKELIVL